MSVSNDQMIEMLRTMTRIRQFETRVQEFFAAGKIPGFVHLYIGEEAVATGACGTLGATDYITSTHRGHGHLIAKGGDLKLMMAEIFGRRTGYCKGKGGSMHIAAVELGILGANGIVGGGGPIANGAALAAKYRGTDQVVVCFFGDGASNQGTTQEALNLASAWKLPVVFLVENNQYGMGTEVGRASAVSHIFQKGCAYDIAHRQVNGQNVLEMYEAVDEALAHARRDGPYLLEAVTYRYSGHSMGDPERYRSKAEIEEWRERDPIQRLGDALIAGGTADAAGLDQVRQAVEVELAEIVTFAEESPEPADAALWEHIYVNPIPDRQEVTTWHA